MVSQFRPISLLNCSFKIIMKVLVIRLREVIGKLVDQAQTSFIRDRLILDNVAIAQEVISETHFLKQCVLLKMDFEKAYDKVNWDFLLELLHVRGFLINGLIGLGLMSGISSVLVNGKEGRKFGYKRGLIQGDPLSLLLFVLVADAFL